MKHSYTQYVPDAPYFNKEKRLSELTTGDRLRKVADAIDAANKTNYPHNQRAFIYHQFHNIYVESVQSYEVVPEEMCGTPMCVAGHAVHLSDEFKITAAGDDSYAYEPINRYGSEVTWPGAGKRALGLVKQPSLDGNTLFDTDCRVTSDALRELADEADNGAEWAEYPTQESLVND